MVMADVSDVPLSDQIEGALHPVLTPRFFGHGAQISVLEAGLKQGRFHHGWIFSGVQGVGKATLAYHLARVLLDGEAGGACLEEGRSLLAVSERVRDGKTGRLISQFVHPDMRVLRRAFDPKGKRFFAAIRIDEMRALRDMLHTTPSMGGRRVILIDRADDLNEASGNALLKVLEEPPAHTVFILIANVLARLPITIRSRCQILKFHGLEFEAFQDGLLQQFSSQDLPAMPANELEELWHLADGSVGRGLELTQGSGLKFYQLLFKILDGLPNLDGRLLDQFIEGVLKDKTGADYTKAEGLLLDMIYRLIKGRAAAQPLSGGEKRLADKLIAVEMLDQWFELWDTLTQNSQDVAVYNLDKKTHLMGCFFHLRTLVRAG